MKTKLHVFHSSKLRWGVLTLLLFLSIGFGAALYFLQFALQAEGNLRGKDIKGSYTFMYKRYPHIREWIDSLHYNNALRDTFIYNVDGTKLHALYAPSANDTCTQTAVIVHGYTDNAVRMLHIGYLYHHDLGYNILLPDLRFSGLSEGDHLQMGWKDRLDVMQWAEVAHERFSIPTKEALIVLHGISMGSATVLNVSGENLPPYIRCIVADCGYTSVWDEFRGELKARYSLPAFPLLHITSALCKLKYGWNFMEASPSNQVEKCPLPIFFIHGDADTFVPTWMGDSLYAHKQIGEKSYWRIPNVEHAEAYLKEPYKYTEKVRNFVTPYLEVR